MLRSTVAALVIWPALAFAAPTPLTSTITRAPLEPAVVVVPADAGKTVLDRYRAHTPPTSGTPLVVIVRLPDANSPDVLAVTDAQRDGTKISIKLEARRYDGALHANEVTTPLVEIALGNLPKGSYTIDIDERILHFSKIDAPQTATKGHKGLQSTISLTVQ